METVNWLHANGYLGLYRGKITFAMRDQTGNVVGVHRWFESEGKLKFLRSPTLLVIGDPTKATILHIHESVWDLVAMIDRTGWHLDLNILLFCTRGVPGAKLVAGRIPTQIQKVYMWEQRDLPDADGRSPNQKWQANVAAAAGCPVYVVPIPQGCKDLNEWTIGLGAISPATADGLKLACEMALLYKAAPRQAKPPGQPIQSTPQDFPPPEERPCFRLYYDPKTINDRLYAPGVYHHAVKHSGEMVYAIDDWLCEPLEAIAKTADNRDSDYGRLLKYSSSKGEEKLWAMPMELLAGDGTEVLSQLLRDGLEISHPHRRKILEYIAQTKPCAFKRCATRTGWHSGTGSLTQLNPGRLVLAGGNTYTGATTVNAGSLIVDGSIASQLTFVNAGTIGGNLSNSGTVGPGDSPGTLTIASDYTQNTTGMLRIQVPIATSAQTRPSDCVLFPRLLIFRYRSFLPFLLVRAHRPSSSGTA